MDLIEAKIHTLSKKGHGVATYSKEGSDVFRKVEVAGSSLGDEVLIEVPKGRKRLKHALLQKIMTPSPIRTTPKCPHIGTCGGCAWQQNDYKWQLQEKQKQIEKLFPSHPITPITGMDHPWHYRGKMEFTFSQDKAKNRYLGLNMTHGRGKVVDLKECHIGPPWAIELLNQVRTWWEERNLTAYHPPADEGSLQTLTIRSSKKTNHKMIILTTSGNPDYGLSKADLTSFVKTASIDANTSIYLLIKTIAKKRPTRYYEMHLSGPEFFAETLLEKTFYMTPQSFFQPNPTVCEKILLKAVEMLKPQKHERLLDLYCGIGTIGISLSNYVSMVTGVEIVPSAICDARYNIDQMQLDNVQMYQTDVKSFLLNDSIHHDADILIVDPPRSGLDDHTIRYINQTKPKKLLYISCNPTTQAEDIQKLDQAKILEIAPFDQFPHTPHIENMVLLTFDQ